MSKNYWIAKELKHTMTNYWLNKKSDKPLRMKLNGSDPKFGLAFL